MREPVSVTRAPLAWTASGAEVELAVTSPCRWRAQTAIDGYFCDQRRSPRSRGAVGARRSRRLLSLRDTARAMSQENVEAARAVRIPLVPETRRHRTLEERVLVRFPALARRLSAAWARLPQHSRLRRAMLVRSVRQGFAALNRRDFDVLLISLDPNSSTTRAQTNPTRARTSAAMRTSGSLTDSLIRSPKSRSRYWS